MLQPARTKFRKAHKGRIKGKATRGASLNFGSHGLQALEPERVTSRQIEAARVALTRQMQRKGTNCFLCCFIVLGSFHFFCFFAAGGLDE